MCATSRIEPEPAAPDAVGVDERLDLEQTLTRRELAFDDPIERAAVDEFLRPRGNHPRHVLRARRAAAADAFGDALGDPFLEIGDRFRADAEFDQMQGHGASYRAPP